MQVHDISKSPPLLAGRGINDPSGIMQFHAAYACIAYDVCSLIVGMRELALFLS
jgi:hypothetical protein